MNEPNRPNPDELLARIQSEEQALTRGKLKIFLGYAAGVGKTYAMLEAAHQRKDEGIDVIIGYIETHRRKETEALLADLEIIPRRQAAYHGANLTELDVDAVLARRPQLALVDELAHTNIPGSRHPKRCMDIEEILAVGIDVYTTVNIQHLESLNDVVQQITGVVMRETIPDRLLDEASEIELVDLPPEELLNRLKEGKVYIPEQASRALEKFFRKGNLTALREMTFRRAADRVDDQMFQYMQAEAIPGPWPAGDRILVTLSSHPIGERLVRTGRRLADDLNAEWYVVYVETPGHLKMPPANRERIIKNLHLAETLGAKVKSIPAASVAEAVLEFAHKHNITKIVTGKPHRPQWFDLLRGSVGDQILRHSGPIDVYVVSEKAHPVELPFNVQSFNRRPWKRYLYSLGLVVLMTLLGFPIQNSIEPTNLVMLYLAGVVIAAVFLGRGPSILASLLSVLAFDFFFINPELTFVVSDTEYILTFIGLLIVGLVISNLAALLRDQVDMLRRRDTQTQAVNVLSRDLTGAMDLDQVLDVVVRNVSETFSQDVVILVPEGSKLVQRAATPRFDLDENEMAVAIWAYEHGQAAGRGTETLTASSIRYLPLKTVRGTVGVLGVKADKEQRLLSPDQRILLENFANLAALAVERSLLAIQASQMENIRNAERLQAALLNSISHELRTPLASIIGVLTSLNEFDTAKHHQGSIAPAARRELIESATRKARQLNQMVGNLLDMTRIQAGAVQLNLEPSDIQDLIGAVLSQMEDRLRNHPVQVELSSNLPLVMLDSVLIGQVLINLLDNAAKYSPSECPISVTGELNGDELVIRVADCGPGIPEADIGRVFDKFYQATRSQNTGGVGLGLSISKGIIEVHGGRIWVENNPDKGVTVSFALPLKVYADEGEGRS